MQKFKTITELKTAVEAGKHVHWKSPAYIIQKWRNGEFFIYCIPSDSAIGLESTTGQLNAKLEDFFTL